MRRALFLLFILITFGANAQQGYLGNYYYTGSVSVGTGQRDVFTDLSAWSQWGKDTTKRGLLFPKVNLDSVSTTKRGLYVYDLKDSVLYHFDGTKRVRYMTYKDTSLIISLIQNYAPSPDLSRYYTKIESDGRYLQSYTETDPVYIASPAFGIGSTDITHWSTAYGWGDHASAGYELQSNKATSFVTQNNTKYPSVLAVETEILSKGYITSNQTITLSGDVSGSGSTAITTTIGASKVLNSMLFGSIDATKINTGVVSNTEFNYLDNVTSSIQTQINGKEPTITHGTTSQYFKGDFSLGTFTTDVRAQFSGTSPIVISSGAVSLAGLTGLGTANQLLGMNSGATAYEYKTFAVGTSGTDFAIAHSVNTVTFNLPDASATARGVLTIGSQTVAGNKSLTGILTLGSYTGGTFANDKIRIAQGNIRMGNGSGDFTLITDASGNVSLNCSGNISLAASGRISYGAGGTQSLVCSDYGGSVFGPDRLNITADKNIRYHTSGSNYWLMHSNSASNSMSWDYGGTITNALQWFSNGNFSINGGGTDHGEKFQVTGTSYLNGAVTAVSSISVGTTITVSGTTGNSLIYTNNATAPATSIGVGIVNYYGTSATNFLGDPVKWIIVKIGGTEYKVPAY